MSEIRNRGWEQRVREIARVQDREMEGWEEDIDRVSKWGTERKIIKQKNDRNKASKEE
jgi:hypothetical protein